MKKPLIELNENKKNSSTNVKIYEGGVIKVDQKNNGAKSKMEVKIPFLQTFLEKVKKQISKEI